jgi:hypothetical protein
MRTSYGGNCIGEGRTNIQTTDSHKKAQSKISLKTTSLLQSEEEVASYVNAKMLAYKIVIWQEVRRCREEPVVDFNFHKKERVTE